MAAPVARVKAWPGPWDFQEESASEYPEGSAGPVPAEQVHSGEAEEETAAEPEALPVAPVPAWAALPGHRAVFRGFPPAKFPQSSGWGVSSSS